MGLLKQLITSKAVFHSFPGGLGAFKAAYNKAPSQLGASSSCLGRKDEDETPLGNDRTRFQFLTHFPFTWVDFLKFLGFRAPFWMQKVEKPRKLGKIFEFLLVFWENFQIFIGFSLFLAYFSLFLT